MRCILFVAGWAAAMQLNPITRVVELLEGLSKKVAMDGDAEQELYDKFKCWCTKVLDAKATSIAANEARISELESYIDDLSSGRVELTSERVELEKEIAGLEKTIAEETAMREKENEDFLAAEDEMTKALAALNQSITVLAEATTPSDGALNAMASKLEKVMAVGKGFLAKSEVAELHKVLDVPDVDWKKLNREATFKKKYTARSGDIQGILADMRDTFQDNLAEAVAAEEKAQTDFDALVGAKKEQLSSAKQALLDKNSEKGARGESLATSEAEKDDLEGQNERDKGYLSDTEATCDERASQWAERKRLRAEEIASIGEAVGILRSDDARDTFKKSFDSQGFFFTQIEETRHRGHKRFQKALALVRQLAYTTKDTRVLQLVSKITVEPEEVDEDNPFVEVLKIIDDLIVELADEEKNDLATKEQCEKERMEKTQQAKMVSKEIDTSVETIDRLTAQIEAANKTVLEIMGEIEDMRGELRDAGAQRDKEHAEYMTAKTDDQNAVELVNNAIGALDKFYERNNLKFVQVRRHGQEPFVEAGEAPTPPPATWNEDYGGASGATGGITSVLTLIAQDIEKDIAKSDKQEGESVAAYDKMVADVEAGIAAKEKTKSDLEGEMASDEGSKSEEEGAKTTSKEELDSTLGYLKEIAAGCDFMAVNFDKRLKNRQLETDGLKKAKAILEGASFE